MLFIILPVHGRIEKTREIVGDICRQTVSDWHLMLIDDGSTDGTADTVKTLIAASRLTIISGDGSLWWGGALQKAWKALNSHPASVNDAVLILNNDVRIAPDFLEVGLRCLEVDRARWVQAIATSSDGAPPVGGVHADLERLEFMAAAPGIPVNCLSTRGLLMSLQSFQRSGGLRPWFLPHYLSDYEFTIRAAHRGIPLVTCAEFVLEMDRQTTGVRHTANVGLANFLRMAFSNRYVENPFHFCAFVILCCPWWSIPVNLLRVWFRFFRNAYGSVRH